jgi:uncharacterized YccA/Bax inhibitor family protein
MSHEGVTLIARTGLVLFLIVVSTVFRYLIGSGQKRGSFMLAGTLVGMSAGLFVASLISSRLKVDTSTIGATLGMILGWGVAWMFARHVPDGV